MSFASAMKSMYLLLLSLLLVMLLMVVMTAPVLALKTQKHGKCYWQNYTGADGQIHSTQICP